MYKCKYSRMKVAFNIFKMARMLKKEHLLSSDSVFLVMLSGGVWFAHQLFRHLGDMNNEVYYIKAHSYQGKEQQDLTWDLLPDADLKDRKIIMIDDICDSGATINAVYQQYGEQARRICAVTLIKRVPCMTALKMPVYACIEDRSQDFFVGCGLDDNERGRLLQHIAVC